MNPLDPILNFLSKVDRRIAFAIFATSGLFLFVPSLFDIFQIPVKVKPNLGLILILGGSFLIYDIFTVLTSWIRDRIREFRKVEILKILSAEEKKILKQYMTEETETINISRMSNAVMSLVSKNILFEVSPIVNPTTHVVPHQIAP